MYFLKVRFFLILLVFLLVHSCIKRPEAAFHYLPETNPEAGEYIEFVNESLDALYYSWDFGNGKTSEEDNPRVKFATPGDYTVTLVAENEHRVDSLSQSILINPPTILEFYFYSYNVSPLLMGTVYIWKTYDEAIHGEEPLSSQNTNSQGRVMFKNLEPRPYFVYLRKDTINGEYAGGGNVGPLEQNKINSYVSYVYFYSDKKSVMIDQAISKGEMLVPIEDQD